jgi:hypothetical protein
VTLLGWVLAAGCGSSGGAPKSPCEMLCDKWNSCRGPTDNVLPCATICVYGGNWYVGIAPSPYCPNLAAQTSCVAAAVAMSCDAYQNAINGCPACPPVDGAPCAINLDCEKYDARYRCDLSKPGGYCTAPCNTADDCSIAGPEKCAASSSPSFDPGATLGPNWCKLGCSSDALCRTDEGYTCVSGQCAPPQ